MKIQEIVNVNIKIHPTEEFSLTHTLPLASTKSPRASQRRLQKETFIYPNLDIATSASKLQADNWQEIADILFKYSINDKSPIYNAAVADDREAIFKLVSMLGCNPNDAVKGAISTGNLDLINHLLKQENYQTTNHKELVDFSIKARNVDLLSQLSKRNVHLGLEEAHDCIAQNFENGLELIINRLHELNSKEASLLLHNMLSRNISRDIEIKFIKTQTKFDYHFDELPVAKPGLLTFASTRNDFEMLELLISKQAPINDGLKNCCGTALACAICQAANSSDDYLARYLLSKGGMIHNGYMNNYSHWIKTNDKHYIDQVKVAIKIGMLSQKELNTLLNVSAISGNRDMALLLLEHGAKLANV
jgi:hypothetical protein